MSSLAAVLLSRFTTHHPSLSVVLATSLVVTPFECCLIASGAARFGFTDPVVQKAVWNLHTAKQQQDICKVSVSYL